MNLRIKIELPHQDRIVLNHWQDQSTKQLKKIFLLVLQSKMK
jgi:hypothetical protein